MPTMPLVEAHGIAGQKPPRDRSDRNSSGPQQQMGVIAHQRPGIIGGLALGDLLR